MEHLRKLIKEILSTPLKGQCGCGCGCDDIPDKGITLNESIAPKEILSENLNYHIKNKLPLTENTFRYGSKAFLDLWAEARALYLREIIHVNEDDKQIIEETNLGNFGLYEGKEVALDLPMLEEAEMTNSLSLRANEIPLMKLMSRVIDNNGKDSPLYKDLETEFKKDTIDMGEVKDIIRDYGVYFEYDDLLNLNEAQEKKKNPPLGKPKRGGSKNSMFT